jgi:uncharacterized protein (TIGR02453 family)
MIAFAEVKVGVSHEPMSAHATLFRGFGPKALPFLKALAFHQNKEWFEENRATYEADLKTPMGDLVEDLSAALAKAKIPLQGNRKSSLFRIHRDVRFAKDKSPYKTHSGAVMTRGGAKNDFGLLYFHVALDGCFTAAGFYGPEPEPLARMRAAMVRAPKAWKQMVAKLATKGLVLDADNAMRRNPKGFETVEDPDIVAALRLKSLVARRSIPEARLAEPDLVADLAAFARDALPLLEWGWSAAVDARD